MKVTLAKSAGFCFGVRRAVSEAEKLAKLGKTINTYGELIHNPHEVDRLKALGLIPENDIFGELAKLNERGYFDSGEDCTTATAGVFVAGDCRAKRIRQLTTACADGAVAALAACEYLDK